MADKSPSSLDYISLLHELTLKNWQTAVMEHDWERAGIAANKLSESHDRFWSWLGGLNLATTHLYQGRTGAGLAHLAQAPAVDSVPDPLSIVVENLKAHIFIETGRCEEAVRVAQKVMASQSSSPAISETLYFYGSSLLRTENAADAKKALDQLRHETESSGRAAVKLRYHQLSSEMALSEGRLDIGLEELERAYRNASSRQPEGRAQNLQAPILFSLAKAQRRAMQIGEAIRDLETVTADSNCLLDWPIYFVRSHYLLGDLYRSQGKFSEAKGEFQRFFDFWGEGDIDRDAIKEARNFLQSEGSQGN